MSECDEEKPVSRNRKAESDECLFRTKKLASLGLVAAGLSHDLNNLLAAILGNNSILLRGLPDDSPWRENARQVEETALRALELNNQLLIFAGKARFSEEMLNLVAIIEDLKEALRLATAKGVQIRYDIPETLPSIPGDSALIRAVIKNLVTNASDAIMNQEGTIHIRMRLVQCDDEDIRSSTNYHGQPAGEYVCIEVKDSGCGMSDEVQERMFDPFFSTRLRGQGMGLSVVFGAAEMHAALLQVSSKLGKGTTIRMLLPRDHARDHDFL
jgi:signal transduction histidine kinase